MDMNIYERPETDIIPVRTEIAFMSGYDYDLDTEVLGEDPAVEL